MRARAGVVVTLLATMALGCGSDEEVNDVEGMSPPQAVRAAKSALGQVRSFRIDGYFFDRVEGRTEFDVDVVIPGRVRLRFEEKGEAAEVIAIAGEGWMKASREFWRANAPDNPQVAELLADKWVKMPPASMASFRYFLNVADPQLVGRCIIGDRFGTLSSAGSAKVAGRDAVIIRDRGDKPGTTPGDLYIAASGRPLPLHIRLTGPERPGGTRDPACSSPDEDDDADSESGEFRFRDYDADIEIKPPKDPVDLESLQQQAQPQSPA